MYPDGDMPLPPSLGDVDFHPSVAHMRMLDGIPSVVDEKILRRIAACYFGLITHMDEQIGEVITEMKALDLMDTTRIIYTSDHGELFGAQGLFGKRSLYEGSCGIPLIIAGPDIKQNNVSHQLASHVDLFPTIIQMTGGVLEAEDGDLPGISLWDALQGVDDLDRPVFAEYHAQGSLSGSYLIRQGDVKMILHIGMSPQIFDLKTDPNELHDLYGTEIGEAIELKLAPLIYQICDPKVQDARAKADQRAKAEFFGGQNAVSNAEYIVFTPPPGVTAEEAWAKAGKAGDSMR